MCCFKTNTFWWVRRQALNSHEAEQGFRPGKQGLELARVSGTEHTMGQSMLNIDECVLSYSRFAIAA